MKTLGFGYYLRELREKNKISLRKLAQETNLDPAYLSRVEREMSPAPRAEIVERIAKALCNFQELPKIECDKLKRDLLDSAGLLIDNADLVDDLKQRFAERLRAKGITEFQISDAVNKVDLGTMSRVLSGQEELEIRSVDSISASEIKNRKSKGEEVHVLNNEKATNPFSIKETNKKIDKTKLMAGSRAFIQIDGDLSSDQEELLRSVANMIRIVLKEE